MSCRCGRIRVGAKVTENRNWNPDCPEHGTASEWWNSPEQQAKIAEQDERLRDLQTRAREARRLVRLETKATKGETISSEDTLWLLELINVQRSLIGKYEKFAQGVIELGPDGVAGLVDYYMGRIVPFDKESFEEKDS